LDIMVLASLRRPLLDVSAGKHRRRPIPILYTIDPFRQPWARAEQG
jgi:hypothetical protein